MTARNFYRVDAAGRIEKLSGSILKELTGAATVAAAMDAIRNDMTAGRCCPVLTTPYVRPWPTPAVPACDFRCWISA